MSILPVVSAGMAIETPASRLALQSPALDCAEWSMLRGTSLTAESEKEFAKYPNSKTQPTLIK